MAEYRYSANRLSAVKEQTSYSLTSMSQNTKKIYLLNFYLQNILDATWREICWLFRLVFARFGLAIGESLVPPNQQQPQPPPNQPKFSQVPDIFSLGKSKFIQLWRHRLKIIWRRFYIVSKPEFLLLEILRIILTNCWGYYL